MSELMYNEYQVYADDRWNNKQYIILDMKNDLYLHTSWAELVWSKTLFSTFQTNKYWPKNLLVMKFYE